MPRFHHGAVEIDFLDEGDGDPAILVHGFASTKEMNWIHPGWVSTLRRAGRRVIALDNRGHGRSTKLYRPADYAIDCMAGDVLALADHLGVQRADFMGYSMGGRICALIAARHPERVRCAILGGIGRSLIEGRQRSEDIAAALEAPTLADVTDPTGRAFRLFAEQTKSDLEALAACIRGSGHGLPRAEIASITVPVLVAVGTKDDIAGPAQPLAEIIPGAQVLDIPDRDHMRAVGDRVFKEGVLAFLERRP